MKTLDTSRAPLTVVIAYPFINLALWLLASNSFSGPIGWSINNFTIGVTALTIYPVARALCSRHATWKVILVSVPTSFLIFVITSKIAWTSSVHPMAMASDISETSKLAGVAALVVHAICSSWIVRKLYWPNFGFVSRSREVSE